MKLLIFTQHSSEKKEFIFNVDNKFIQSIDLTSDAADDLTLFGTYRNFQNSNLSGYFLSTIDMKSKEITTKKMEAFPKELIELMDLDGQGSKKEIDPGLSVNFRIKETVQRANGSIDFILEYYTKIERISTNKKGITTFLYDYYYEDIVVINVNKAGKTTFVRIPKQQHDTQGTFCSFTTMPYGNKLLLFYNDNKKNITQDLTKAPISTYSIGSSSFVMTIIDENGEFTREELFSNQPLPVTTTLRYCTKISKNKMCFVAHKMQNNLKYQVGLVEIK